MTKRKDIVDYINSYLNSAAIADSSANGLQIEGKEEVKKIVFGVSANAEFFKRAVKAGADMVIVHHGLFWGKEQVLTGIFKKRVELLIKNDISLAAWHLPLDLNKNIGNNAVLARELGLKNIKPFGQYHGQVIGFSGTLPKALTTAQARKILNAPNALTLDFGPKQIKTVAIVSGGGYAMLEQACAIGADLFITGSSEEFAHEIAREGKINYMGIGHYNSETRGVKELMKTVAKKFKVKTEFIDIPNPI